MLLAQLSVVAFSVFIYKCMAWDSELTQCCGVDYVDVRTAFPAGLA
jgi:hypothetical protein